MTWLVVTLVGTSCFLLGIFCGSVASTDAYYKTCRFHATGYKGTCPCHPQYNPPAGLASV